MPRENRKRGKKHKKQQPDEEEQYNEPVQTQDGVAQHAGPSWIVERSGLEDGERPNLDAPFGYVDADVKAYFRTVDTKLREWQEANDGGEVDEGEDTDPNEERRMFLVAALSELSGKERQLATDPDCSNVLERMSYSMDDFVKRVLLDRLAGSFEELSKHRFGSHVIQTLLSVSKGTVSRESKGVFPPSPEGEEIDSQGRLPHLTQLILNLSEELLQSTTNLLMDPFASHVLRALFVLLSPALPSAADSSFLLRSKKSAKHRAKQGPMKSVFTDGAGEQDDVGRGKGKSKAVAAYPPEFDAMARKFVLLVRENLGANEVRALGADKVACPILALLLEMESAQGTSNEAGSLMDSVSAGLVSASLQNSEEMPESSDYVTTLLREPTSSHLLEKLISLAPDSAFEIMWELYFSGKLNKLAVHPVANFVVARAIERSTATQLSSIIEEMQGVWPKIIKNARTGVLKALIDRSVQLGSHEEEVVKVIFDAFGLTTPEEQLCLVECVLYLKTYSEYQEALKSESEAVSSAPMEPTVQGSVLVQSLLQLHAPHNQVVIQSVTRLPPARLLSLAHHPVSSRIFDALVTTPSVPTSAHRRLILALRDHFPALIDDRIGSRVGERLWTVADPYLKEKVARGLIPHENTLVGSRYGKYFMRGLNLYLLKRNPEEWKAQQAQASAAAKAQNKDVKPPKATTTELEGTQKDKKPKRKRAEAPQDEIDAVFNSALGKRQKKASLAVPGAEQTENQSPSELTRKLKKKGVSGDKELDSVLGAIRSAPKDLKTSGKRKK